MMEHLFYPTKLPFCIGSTESFLLCLTHQQSTSQTEWEEEKEKAEENIFSCVVSQPAL